MSEAIGIGYFQTENLVRNRVPMAVVMIGTNLDVIYPPARLEHLRMNTLSIEGDSNDLPELVAKITALKIPGHFPILLVCKKGDQSKTWANEITGMGFTNAYYVIGGSQALLKEFRESEPL